MINPKKSQKCDSVKAGEKGVTAQDKAKIAAQAIVSGKTQRQAAILAGLPASQPPLRTKRVRSAVSDLQAQREALRGKKGYMLQDSAKFYTTMASSKMVSDSDRIRAQTRLDQILGYDAPPDKVQDGDRESIAAAVAVLASLTVSPAQLLTQIGAE